MDAAHRDLRYTGAFGTGIDKGIEGRARISYTGVEAKAIGGRAFGVSAVRDQRGARAAPGRDHQQRKDCGDPSDVEGGKDGSGDRAHRSVPADRPPVAGDREALRRDSEADGVAAEPRTEPTSSRGAGHDAIVPRALGLPGERARAARTPRHQCPIVIGRILGTELGWVARVPATFVFDGAGTLVYRRIGGGPELQRELPDVVARLAH